MIEGIGILALPAILFVGLVVVTLFVEWCKK